MASRSKLNLNLGKRKALDPTLKEKFDQVMERHGVLEIDGENVKVERDDMEDLGEIGFGTCGHVYKMRHKQSGTLMAVKQMPRNNNEEEIKRIAMDLDVVLKSRDCKYIVHCLGCFIFTAEVWICMELMATCFDRLLKKTNKPIPERILGKVTVATVEALSYLKDKHNVIHRDIKPSNILLDERGNVKLCDFGISGRLVDSNAKTRSAGCAAYMAPERIDPSQRQYDIRADVWSLGITLVELATGLLPYHDCKTDFEVLTKVIECDPPRLPPDRFSQRFYDFVEKCLTKDCHLRPKYKELLETDFILYYKETPVDVGGWYRAVHLQEMFKDAPSYPLSTISNGHATTVAAPTSSSLSTPTNTSSTHDSVNFAQLQFNPTNPFAVGTLAPQMDTMSLGSSTKDSTDSVVEVVTPPPRRSLQSSPMVPPTPRHSVTASPKMTPPPRRSLTNSPMRTPTPGRNGLSVFTGLNKCFCELKDSVEPPLRGTSPILLQRYLHQRKQSMEADGSIHCLKCNNTRKVSSANAALGSGSDSTTNMRPDFTPPPTSYVSSTYLNGVSSPRQNYRFPTSHLPFSSDDSHQQYRSTDAYLNSSCDTTSTSSTSSSNMSGSNHQHNLQLVRNLIGMSPRLNGNRYEEVRFTQQHQQQSTLTSTSSSTNNYYNSIMTTTTTTNNSTASVVSPFFSRTTTTQQQQQPPPLFPRTRQPTQPDASHLVSSSLTSTPPLSNRPIRSPPSYLSLPPPTITPPETSQQITTRMSTVSRVASFFTTHFKRNNNN